MHLLLVIPCYNEELRLPLDELRRFAMDGVRIEFLLVNDGSKDGTLRLLESLQAEDPSRFSVLNLEQNAGKAEAVRRGMHAAIARRPDFAGYWDADLATPLSELRDFLAIFSIRPEVDMVFAARVRLLGRSIKRNPRRHYAGRVGATLISASLGLAVYDTQCGAKLFRVSDAMGEIFEPPFLSRWIFDSEIIARVIRQRGRDGAAAAIYELPIKIWHDVKGSKVKSTDFLKSLYDLWKIHRAYHK